MSIIQSMREFEDMLASNKETLVVVHYTLENNPKYKEIGAEFIKFQSSYEGALFASIDMNDNEEIGLLNGVKNIPTFQFFKNNDKIDEIFTIDPKKLQEVIKRHYTGDEIVSGDFVMVSADKNSNTQKQHPDKDEKKEAVIKVLNTQQWDTIISSAGTMVVIALFSATWCAPCKKITPIYITIAEEKQGQAIFLKLDADECKAIFEKAGVKNLPTFLCFRMGKKVAEHTGSGKDKLKEMIQEEIRIAHVLSVAEECTSEPELRVLFKTIPCPISYDGFEPSGRMHLAQSVLKSIHINKMAKCGIKSIFWIADWHAMLNGKMGGQLKKIKTIGRYMIEVWKACGMDMDHVEFQWAADMINSRPNEYWMLVMNIARKNSMGRVKKCYPIMGKTENDEREKETGAHILYPCMQCADIFFLKANICQLGMDQQQVNVLAREYAELNHSVKPVILSHHLLPGLKEGQKKMSASDPQSAIFVDDTVVEVKTKIKKSFCPPGVIEGNPCMEYLKYIVFAKLGTLTIKRKPANGGNKIYKNYLELESDYRAGQLHPGDLKPALSTAINQILEPIRAHFKKGELKQLLTQVKKLK